MVRLKVDDAYDKGFKDANFNSKMVRLKVKVSRKKMNDFVKFQFQNGAIKSALQANNR